jgi:hypothetical protein
VGCVARSSVVASPGWDSVAPAADPSLFFHWFEDGVGALGGSYLGKVLRVVGWTVRVRWVCHNTSRPWVHRSMFRRSTVSDGGG